MAPHDPGSADLDPFTALVNEHWTAVYRLLYRLTGDTHDTEDLTQETFLRAFRQLDRLPPGARLRAWLLRIASNAYFDVHRRRQRLRIAPLESEPVSRARPPEQALEIAEQSALVKAAMEELSELTRLVFHLRAQEDLPFKEIAAIAGTTEQAARWHMHQARVKLLKHLGETAD